MLSPYCFGAQFHQLEHPDFISGQPPPMYLLPVFLSAILILHVCLVQDAEGGSRSSMRRLSSHVTCAVLEGNSWCSVSELHFDSFALFTTGLCQPYLRAGRPHLQFLPAYLQHRISMPFLLTTPTVSSFVDFGAACSPVKTLFTPHTFIYPLGIPRGGIPMGQ